MSTTLAVILALIAVPMFLVKLARGNVATQLGIVPFENDEIVGILGGSVIVLLIMFPPLPSGKYFRVLVGSRPFLALWAAVAFIMATALGILVLPWHPVLALSLLVPCVLVTAMRAIMVASSYCDGLVAMAYPEQFPLEQLLAARRSIAPHNRRLAELDSRAAAARSLEAAAVHITGVWPRQVRPLDVATRRWFAIQCRNLVTHFTAVANEVLWTNIYRTDARDSIDKLIRAFVDGSVAKLAQTPRTDTGMEGRPAYWERIKSLVIGILPLAILYILHLIELPIPATALPWLTVVAYAWALVGCLAVIDPLLERRIAASRGVLDLIKPPWR